MFLSGKKLFLPRKFSTHAKKQGFSLLELILYISVSASVVLMCSLFLQMLQEVKVKSQIIANTNQEGVQAMEIMAQILRNAQEINSPQAGFSSNVSFSVETPDPAKNPTVIDFETGVIRMTEAAGNPVNLTSSAVTVSGLSFSNVARPNTAGVLRIQFTLTSNTASGRNEYQYTKTFYDSISVR